MTDEEWNFAQGGRLIGKVLSARNKHEVAVAGVARVRAQRSCFLEKLRDIETFKKTPSVRQIGKLSTEINVQDLDRLTLEPEDVLALRDCRPRRCSLRVPIAVIQRLAMPVPEDEDRGDSERANRIFREELVHYTRSYVAQGDRALIQYSDKSRPVPLANEFHSLLGGWKALHETAPELYKLLGYSPERSFSSSEQFIYWSKESFGLKPVISVTHVTISQLPDRVWIGSKQIFANHYFDASLSITLAIDDPADPSSFYLLYANRSRIDLLRGAFAGLRRAIVRGRLQDGMRKNLQQTVTAIESSCACSVENR